MSVNAAKYRRLLDHLADDGKTDYPTLVEVLKLKKPELIQQYLQQAVDEDDEDPVIVANYAESLVPDGSTDHGDPGEPGEAGEPGEPDDDGLGDDLDQSEPVSGPYADQHPEEPTADPVAEQNGSPVYQLRNEKGLVVDLQVLATKGNRVILTEVPKEDIVNIVYKGQVVPVDVAGVNERSTVNILGESVSGQTVLLAAQLARA